MAHLGDPKMVALAGIPNVGKTTVFNRLTGLNQKIGNYPGITVDKKIGKFSDDSGLIDIIDLPGTYNIYPRSEDEMIVFRVLCGMEKKAIPEAVLIIADLTNIERSLFFATQIIDLGIPAALVLNMEDAAKRSGISVNKTLMSRLLGIPIVVTSAKLRDGMMPVREIIAAHNFKTGRPVVNPADLMTAELQERLAEVFPEVNPYVALQLFKQQKLHSRLNGSEKALRQIASDFGFNPEQNQNIETRLRYQKVRDIIEKSIKRDTTKNKSLTRNLDKVFLNKTFGLLILAAILFVVFQAIFAWAALPMDWIDMIFSDMAAWVGDHLPPGALTSFIADGLIPGIGGIVIFVPQIALLFGFLAVLEGTGYMARAVFITDRLMRPFGLNGRSVVPLLSGMACAIPAIMATRTISNTKDRLITIFVTPLMSCSARLPVYIILIGLVIPDASWGPFQLQGMALFGMYLLGIAAALVSALAMKVIMRRQPSGSLVIELPRYRLPNLKNVGLTMYEKAKTFVVEAGKIIIAISVILWVLASYGPADEMERAADSVEKPAVESPEAMKHYNDEVASRQLEASYAGHIGKFIEPVIKPLGYDWRIGIALLTSFAAREVFVSTIATLYSIGDGGNDDATLQQKLRNQKNPETGEPFFTFAVGVSLLVFYAFAMQCMSTIAVVYRETKSYRWPIIQTVYMTALAYFSSLLVYQLLS